MHALTVRLVAKLTRLKIRTLQKQKDAALGESKSKTWPPVGEEQRCLAHPANPQGAAPLSVLTVRVNEIGVFGFSLARVSRDNPITIPRVRHPPEARTGEMKS